jgi:hypothetical protein
MAPGTKRNGKIDEQIEETFPASDPPSFMGGEVLGAPKGRKTPSKAQPQLLQRRKSRKKAKPAKKKAVAKKKNTGKKKKRATKKRKSR